MGEYTTTIGLEVHAELRTQTKMFCQSKNDSDEKRPNVNVCPVCMGHPGTLPVPNKQAIHHVLRVGTALNSTLADFSEFDRKNYFYPDLPKGYQISQYQHPLIVGGSLNGVQLTRIHLEEDAARNYHGDDGSSLIDYNRAGVPLMELVTEPVIKSAEEAVSFARELQLLLRTLGASEANLEKGEMRFDVNVSLSPNAELGTKVEIKNVNSFRSLERSVAFEIERQSEILNAGEMVVQETRGWDDVNEATESQRIKESSHDYRYFPDPDIAKFLFSKLPELAAQELRKTLPELPWDRRVRYASYGLRDSDINILVTDIEYSALADDAIFVKSQDVKVIQTAINLLLSEIRGTPVTLAAHEALLAGALVDVASMFATDQISSKGAKDVLKRALTDGGDVRDLAHTMGLLQVTDATALEGIVESVIEENPIQVAQYKGGQLPVLQYLIGMCIKKSKNAGKPTLFKSILESKLG